MFKLFRKKLKLWQSMNRNNQPSGFQVPQEKDFLTKHLAYNLSLISKYLGKSTDVVIREVTLTYPKVVNSAIIYIDGLVDNNMISRDILTPLMLGGRKIETEIDETRLISFILSQVVVVGDVNVKASLQEVIDNVLSGDTVLLIDNTDEALIFSTKGWEKRSIEEPVTEVVVRGPREGFTENLRTNTALLRRKIRNPNLTFESLRIGRQTQTDICIIYIKGIVQESLIAEIKRRLKRIHTDAILESGYVEEFIEDAPFSLFPTIYRSERPDNIAGKILEGRAAVLVAGTPFVLIVPMLFTEVFQSPEDYYIRAYYGSLLRWIRFTAFGLSLLLPAIYVALLSFHQELIPTPLLITLAASREGLPFPPLIEALGMGLIFELLREAGIRLPRPIGQAVSIVGALVIGQAVVTAGLVGAPMVIVVALTAIASFVIPLLAELTSLLRIGLTILAGMFGAFGILIGLLFLLVHLNTLRSFGVPYLSPIVPFMGNDLKDVVIRAPWWAMFLRPDAFHLENQQRQEFILKPNPPKSKKRPRSNPE